MALTVTPEGDTMRQQLLDFDGTPRMSTPSEIHELVQSLALELLEQVKQLTGDTSIVVSVRSPSLDVRVKRRGRKDRPPTQCERDLLLILSDAVEPLTTTRILEILDRRGMLHGECTVKETLARLSRQGVILASRRSPRGYTLQSEHAPMSREQQTD